MANTEQALNKAREALETMRNLGVSLNDYDSHALDTLCDFAESALTAASAEAATPVAYFVDYGNRVPELMRILPKVGLLHAKVTPLYAAPQSSQPAGQTAEDYLRSKYGAYRGHHAWRELEEAFNAGKASNSQPVSGAMTDEQIDALIASHGTGGWQTIEDMRKFARSILSASGQAGQTEAPVNVPQEFDVRCDECSGTGLAYNNNYKCETCSGTGFVQKMLYSAAPAPVQTEAQQSEKDAELEAEALRLYAKWTDGQGVHCNRFPSWAELSPNARNEWLEKAAIAKEKAK